MKYGVIISRILLGLPFLVFGANALHPFMPMPPMSGDSGTFLTIMMNHGWTAFIGVLYVIAGLLLLAGRYVPVALVILGPILVVILLYHVTLAPNQMAIPVVFTLLEVFLIYAYWPAFRGIFTHKVLRLHCPTCLCPLQKTGGLPRRPPVSIQSLFLFQNATGSRS